MKKLIATLIIATTANAFSADFKDPNRLSYLSISAQSTVSQGVINSPEKVVSRGFNDRGQSQQAFINSEKSDKSFELVGHARIKSGFKA